MGDRVMFWRFHPRPLTVAVTRALAAPIGAACILHACISASWAGGAEDLDLFERYFECRAAANAAACKARAAHEAGLVAEEASADRAISLYEKAIASDPSYAPAYASLARAIVRRGDGIGAAVVRMRHLLAKAPRTPEIDRIRRIVEGAVR